MWTKRILAAAALCWTAAAAPLDDEERSPIDLALERAFPDCEVERIVCRLDDDAREEVGEIAEQDAYGRGATFAYIARDADGEVVGTAFFDAHRVRTKRETLLVAVTPDGRVKGVETIAFQEPPEYIAQDAFYASLQGREQGRGLVLGRGLDGTTGATLTCRAVAGACRRVLALHEVLGEEVGREEPKPEPEPEPEGGGGS